MLNLCTVLLRLMQSLYTIAPTANLEKVDPRYSAAPECRLPLSNESCLAKGTISELQSGWGDRVWEVYTLLTFVPDSFVRQRKEVTDGTVLCRRK